MDGLLADRDRIFTNLGGRHSTSLEAARRPHFQGASLMAAE